MAAGARGWRRMVGTGEAPRSAMSRRRAALTVAAACTVAAISATALLSYGQDSAPRPNARTPVAPGTASVPPSGVPGLPIPAPSVSASSTLRSPPGSSPSPGGPSGTSTAGSFVGLVNPRSLAPRDLVAKGYTTVVLQAGWDLAQPTAGGALDRAYIDALSAEYRSYRAAGLSVTLDPGLHYAPAWVLALPGARFVNQYGEQFQAPTTSGENAAAAIDNPEVQAAQAAYLGRLAAAFGRSAFAAVRVGGLLTGELRYPKGTSAHPDDSFWAFSSTAQAASPVPGYRPGVSPRSADDDRAFLANYLRGMVAYQDFLTAAIGRVFSGDLLLMYPSFGIRPGDVDAAVKAGLDGSSVRASEVVQGVDFAALIARIPAYATQFPGRRVVAYTTWLDGARTGTSAQRLDPASYLVSLARPLGVPVAGENTADVNADASRLALCRRRAAAEGLIGWMWLDGSRL